MRVGVSLCCCVFSVQLEAFEVSVSPDLQQQLASFMQELGVNIPSPVSHLKLTTGQCVDPPHGSGKDRDLYIESITWFILSSLQTPAARCLWFRGRWRRLSRHSVRAEPGSCPGRLRRSTGTPGPAATSTRDRWPL